MGENDDPVPDDPSLQNALAAVPKAKAGTDQWAHEGRLRPSGLSQPPLELEPGAEPPPELAREGQPRKPTVVPIVLPAQRDPRILLGIGALVAVLVLVVFVLATRGPSKSKAALPISDGLLLVSSNPAGADILLGGKATGQLTNGKLEHLPVDTPLTLSVKKAGYMTEPASRELTLSPLSRSGAADFTLYPARTFQVVSDPLGADVAQDKAALPGRTPLELPPLKLGAKATLTVTKDGYLPHLVELAVAADTATVVRVVLEAARSIEVWSEPPGAKVFIDDREVGTTPADVLVPADKKFNLRVERTGFKTIKKSLRGERVDKRVLLDLETLPLTKLPLSAEERRKLAGLERDLAKVRHDLAAAKSGLKKAELDLKKAEGSRHNFVADTSNIEASVERFRTRSEELESRLEELTGELDGLRDEILGRFK